MVEGVVSLLDKSLRLKMLDLLIVVCAFVTHSTLVALGGTMLKQAEKFVRVETL